MMSNYEDFFMLHPMGMCILDMKGTIIETNNAFTTLLGFDEKELNNSNFFLLLQPTELAQIQKNLPEIINKSLENQSNFRKKEQTYVKLVWSINLIEKNKQLYITAKPPSKGTKAHLDDKSRAYANIIENHWDGIIFSRMDGQMLFANRAAKKIHGYGRQDKFEHKNISELYKHDDKRAKEIAHAIKEYGGWNGEAVHLKKNGEEFCVLLTISVIFDTTSHPMGLVLTVKDITERKEMEEELVQAEKMASLGLLTAGIAHEINNPVNYISGGVQNIQLIINDFIDYLNLYQKLASTQGEEKQLELRQQLENLNDETGGIQELKEDADLMIRDVSMGIERVIEIVKGLRNFARGDQDTPQQADIHELIDTALVILRNKYKGRVEIIKKFGSKTPNLVCFPGPLSQVFMNLIGNGIDAIGGKGAITIETNDKSGGLEVIITDTGSGIPSKVIDQIFNPFFTTKGVGKGTGLGLSIVQGIIEKHRANISVDSEEGKGTAFTIFLPKKEASFFIDE